MSNETAEPDDDPPRDPWVLTVIAVIIFVSIVLFGCIPPRQTSHASLDAEAGLVNHSFVPRNCSPAKIVERRLKQRFDEERVSIAVTSDGQHLVERWESLATGTWTLLLRTNGLLCVIGAGSGWQEKPTHLRGPLT